jgi:hypothetical protein
MLLVHSLSFGGFLLKRGFFIDHTGGEMVSGSSLWQGMTTGKAK